MKSIGISLGASSVKIVEAHCNVPLQRNVSKIEVGRFIVLPHEGNPRKVLERLIEEYSIDFGYPVAVTGRNMRHCVNLPSISEPHALELSLEFVNSVRDDLSDTDILPIDTRTISNGVSSSYKTYDALVSVGGENFIVYALNQQGKVVNVYTGNKCASGTGEFFLQQIRRMNISIGEAVNLAKTAQPHKIAGRCSVFCKSDCTHALNRGEFIGSVVSGLCQMMAGKILELLRKIKYQQIVVVGGVTQNKVVMDFLRQEVKGLFIPQESPYFEALGAAIFALHNNPPFLKGKSLFKETKSSFDFFPPIDSSSNMVEFKEIKREPPDMVSEYILGLDVGSTTTKAVVVRLSDLAMVASVYLRTNGDPVGASQNCYQELLKQLPQNIEIIGLGVTGSGRQIAGLHALTDVVVNEIIAHASSAAYFDKEVDTIFEIGGQDAKYTYLSGSVACDYAMNEACSAGTGSFLEEAAKESLGVELADIAPRALRSIRVPNFNDQCAAFISSDIKTAAGEGIDKSDIVGGLVYSICMNYNNRVKGSRPVGEKIFMQGGVCYNKAVPLAMAQLLGKKIVVPPEPGLMGAFGAAWEVKNRIELKMAEKKHFDLKVLAERRVSYNQPFICKAQRDTCDRNCKIELIEIEGKVYPFGGACSRYYNLRLNSKNNVLGKNLVDYRQKQVFRDYSQKDWTSQNKGKTIGFNRSFLVNSLFPLYYHFFRSLGLRVVLSSHICEEGIDRQRASFCFPAAVSHGFFADLLSQDLDYVFLPQVLELPVKNSVSTKKEHQSTCHLLQAEPYYLKAAFKDYFDNANSRSKIITLPLDFSGGYEAGVNQFMVIGKKIGFRGRQIKDAYNLAVSKQKEFERTLKIEGEKFLKCLESDKNKFAVVLFGRSYNAFCQDTNMAVPQKFSSRGVDIIPFDFLPFEYAPIEEGKDFLSEQMTWATGQMLMRCACFVKRHQQLFGVYITNFSCGPDSFLVGYFRDIMGRKPSLTLELDSHTQGTGLDTRVEAFLEIVNRYRIIKEKDKGVFYVNKYEFYPAQVVFKGNRPGIISSRQKEFSLNDRKVKMLIPPMGDLGTEAISAVLKRAGINAYPLETPNSEVLKLGRACTTCKECLPLQLTAGGLLKYLQENREKDELIVYFMPTVSGNCRFSQYNVFLKNLIKKNKIEDVAVLSISSENGYLGLGRKFTIPALAAVIVSDVMDDIRNTLMALASNANEADLVFKSNWESIIDNFKGLEEIKLEQRLYRAAGNLFRKVKLMSPLEEAKVVSLHGEIYVRRELFSRGPLIKKLAQQGFVVKTASVLEWLYYVDYLVTKGIIENSFGWKQTIEFFLKRLIQPVFERRIKDILSFSGVYQKEVISVPRLVKRWGSRFVDVTLTGEPILAIGTALEEIGHSICGMISVGPFGCLPTRVTESVLSCYMNADTKFSGKKDTEIFENFSSISEFPFLSVEVDGNPFAPITQARLETFCLQAERLHRVMKSMGNSILPH